MTHIWVPDNDEGMLVCGDCDTYKGSHASMKPCPAAPKEEEKMESKVECRYCHAEVPGATRSDAAQDALSIGWQGFGSRWQCGDCLNEQDAQR